MTILDLKKSTYIDKNNNFTYYFSSNFNLLRFRKGLNKYVDYNQKIMGNVEFYP